MMKADYDVTFRGRRKIVGVMGSGERDYPDLTGPLGRRLAELGYHLLTGGGGGVMEGVSQSFFQTPKRHGLVLGIIRSAGHPNLVAGQRAYIPQRVNPWVELPIFTHLPLSGAQGRDFQSRNHINVLTSDVVIALPGGDGTASEVELALEYQVPLIFHLGGGKIGALDPLDCGRKYPFTSIADSLDEVEFRLQESK